MYTYVYRYTYISGRDYVISYFTFIIVHILHPDNIKKSMKNLSLCKEDLNFVTGRKYDIEGIHIFLCLLQMCI